ASRTTISKAYVPAVPSRRWDGHQQQRTEANRGAYGAVTNHHRRCGVWRISRRQGSPEDPSAGHLDRPRKSPSFSALALSGCDFRADARSDWYSDPRYLSESEEHYRDPR